jgi:hypothetical protein
MRTRIAVNWGAASVLLISCMLWQCGNKNPSSVEPPLVVSAGPDSTVALNQYVNLVGTATEEGVPDTAFVYSWACVSGPDSVTIFGPSSPITRIKFRKAGIYQISLTVSDGVIAESDTAVYTVTDSIPFTVLRPAAGDRVTIGDSVLIEWQIVTPLTQTEIDLSTDQGITWTTLTVPSLQDTTRWMWHVDSNLQPSDSILVKVRDYNNSSHFAESGYFSLVR